jgi:hypothetical protein
VLPPGATLFTGRSKDGKSLLAWNLCVAVATGGKALGTFDVPQGDVLYLCLEDGERRAQKRLDDQMAYMGMQDPPDNLEIVTRDTSTVGDGFEAKMTGWLEDHPQARLIVIDILEKVRPKRSHTGSVYAEDYAALSPIQQIAQDRNVAILVIHHSNKTKPEDFRDSASGSMGLLAACDTFWSLARLAGAADAVLNIIGRDVDSPALALQFQDGFWTVIGTARKRSSPRRAWRFWAYSQRPGNLSPPKNSPAPWRSQSGPSGYASSACLSVEKSIPMGMDAISPLSPHSFPESVRRGV